jgi:hypothetical protein
MHRYADIEKKICEHKCDRCKSGIGMNEKGFE